MSWFAAIVVGFLGIFLLKRWLKNKTNKPLPPGPSTLESLLLMKGFIADDNMREVAEKFTDKYGEMFNVPFLGNNMVFINSTRLARKVLTSAEYKDFTNDRPPSFLRDYLYKGGNNIGFRNYDEVLVKLRRTVHGVVKLYGEGIREFENLIIGQLLVMENELMEAVGDDTFNLQIPLKRTLTQIVHIFLTNQKAENVDEVSCIVEDFIKCTNKTITVDNNFILSLFPFLYHIPGQYSKLVSDLNKNTKRLLDYFANPEMKRIVMNTWSTAHDPSLWKDPKVFRPERYLDEDGHLLPSDDPIRNLFTPFGVGRRLCVGEIFARSRIFLFVTSILQKFEIQKGDNEIPSTDSADWIDNGALQPPFLHCKIIKRTK